MESRTDQLLSLPGLQFQGREDSTANKKSSASMRHNHSNIGGQGARDSIRHMNAQPSSSPAPPGSMGASPEKECRLVFGCPAGEKEWMGEGVRIA